MKWFLLFKMSTLPRSQATKKVLQKASPKRLPGKTKSPLRKGGASEGLEVSFEEPTSIGVCPTGTEEFFHRGQVLCSTRLEPQ